jgi:hypothetical protein
MSIISEFKEGLVLGYSEITGSLSPDLSPVINVFIFAILISLYCVFTWKFYNFLSKKDLIELNLNQYNKTLHPVLNKLVAVFFYVMEYMIILPFIIFFWFAILALLIMVLSEELSIKVVIMISAAIVASIRILAYYEVNLSKDLAKIFPFTALTIFLLTPGFFNLQRIFSNFEEIPSLLGNIVYFIIFIIAIEFILRMVDLFMSFWRSEEED